MPTATRRPRGSLTHDEVIDAALTLVDDDGVGALTMRRLADRLGVNPMTLYLRFENKDELLAAMVGRRLAAVPAPSGDGSLEDRLVEWTTSVRDQLVGVGDLFPAIRSVQPLATTMLDGTEHGLGLMVEAGLADQAAVDAMRALFWHAVGFAVLHPSLHARAPELLDGADLSAETHPNLVRLGPLLGEFEGDELFRRTTRALVHGLVADDAGPT